MMIIIMITLRYDDEITLMNITPFEIITTENPTIFDNETTASVTTITQEYHPFLLQVFSGLMPLFLREHWNGLYRTDIFFLTRSLLELPVFLVGPVGFTAIIYYMVGLR